MSNINDTQLIELYYNKLLNFSEREDVEDRLKNEPEFYSHYRQYVSLTEGIEKLGNKETKAYLNELESRLEKPNTNKKKALYKRSWMAAASILIILFFKFYINTQHTGLDIYQEYHKSYPLLFNNTTRGEATNDINKDKAAYLAYEAGNYAKAVRLFDETNETELFYKANALLANNEAEKALKSFKQIEETSKLFDTQASWYIALCQLNMNQNNEAIIQLEKIIASNSSYNTRAKEILVKLK